MFYFSNFTGVTIAALTILFAANYPIKARAGESVFGFLVTTDLLPKGGMEIEQWLTWRRQKAGGKFDLIQGRTAFEYGVTDDFQAAIYANYACSRDYHNGVDGATAPPENFADARVGPNSHWHSGRFVSVSLEGIYRILSPYIHPFGLAYYFEPTGGKGLFEVENRIIVQKNFLDDRLIVAPNVSMNREGRRLPGNPEETGYASRYHWDHETDFNIALGVSYRFIPNWSTGFEFINEREYSNFGLSSSRRNNVAYYLGPMLYWGGERFFATATFLTQLPWAQDFANPPAGFIKGGWTYADDFEKFRLRFKTSRASAAPSAFTRNFWERLREKTRLHTTSWCRFSRTKSRTRKTFRPSQKISI